MACTVIPRAEARLEMPPNVEMTSLVFMGSLKHTLQPRVKHTLMAVKYDCHMTTLEERMREAIKATELDVKKLAERIGVTRQAVYDWMKGKGLSQIKAENLVELANLARYEPLWILKGKGPKKKDLTQEQERVLVAMETPATQKMIL